MIETDGGGSITVRVCSDPANPGATLTIPVESAGDHDAAQDQHCPWGALAVAPIVPDNPALPETLARAAPVPAAAPFPGRSAARRVGQVCVRPCRSRWWPTT